MRSVDHSDKDYSGKDYSGKDYSGKDYSGKDHSGKERRVHLVSGGECQRWIPGVLQQCLPRICRQLETDQSAVSGLTLHFGTCQAIATSPASVAKPFSAWRAVLPKLSKQLEESLLEKAASRTGPGYERKVMTPGVMPARE
jgi:hypothetical protein